jgi:hypothetical protein
MGAFPTIAQVGQHVGLSRLRAFGLRMRVWWAKDRLTRELASGVASIDSRELALRAGQLTAKSTREVVACSIEDLLQEAARPNPVLTAKVPIDSSKVTAVSEQLSDLADRLRTPDPVRPQGMALVLLLLTDTERPLFGTGTEDELSTAIVDAMKRLENAGST